MQMPHHVPLIFCLQGLYRKAEALYRMGNFEHALVFYHRGNKIRPDLEEFILGIQKAQEAIANSIGTPEGCKLEKTGDLSFFKQQDTVGKKKPTKGQKAAQQQIKARLGPVATERTMKELLGELYIDYDYLEKLSKDAEIGNTDDTIYGLIHSGMSYLDARAEFWRQQKPMYTRKREKELKKWKPPPTRPQNPSRNTRSNREQDPIDHAKFAIKSIEEIDNSLSSGDAEKSLFQAEQAMMTVQSLTEAELPNKMQFIATLHSCIGNAHLELGHVDVALEHFEKDMQIATEEDYVEAKGRAFFNLGKAYTIMGNYDEGIK
jgi:tetratricopeptide (TPR) repeat protein